MERRDQATYPANVEIRELEAEAGAFVVCTGKGVDGPSPKRGTPTTTEVATDDQGHLFLDAEQTGKVWPFSYTR
ncbi:hypothetical protein [Corynebacterium cystitidis]|uniref:Uncharacterized protein n=1 Tax=Corynebacterium cystitidis DSM 20524 TaxID=1121357 RepID=A0A1H9QRB6_9CORY|nr:hypothetical protein [Corynebacterium cystitidis]WJY81705.1 hypothetical protein CCYS_03700 [Corynebacterium cystitidis DSM 20524]SER62379.1 hypothetical protein SAMN05661109_00625 [Corynebacterium cystitidis DSM 20524]SNV84684.1 Uncharacterised protein [Corynebacterium cystitidis]